MFSTDFKENLVSLRLSIPYLSPAIMSDLLGLKSRTSINNMESGMIYPSLPVLIKIADLFGVNIDWLVGRSSDKFSNQTLIPLESKLIRLATKKDIPVALTFYRMVFFNCSLLQSKFDCLTSRLELFSLTERSSVVFSLNILKRASEIISFVNPDLSMDTVDFGALHILLFPSLKKFYGKTTANNELHLWKDCFFNLKEVSSSRRIMV